MSPFRLRLERAHALNLTKQLSHRHADTGAAGLSGVPGLATSGAAAPESIRAAPGATDGSQLVASDDVEQAEHGTTPWSHVHPHGTKSAHTSPSHSPRLSPNQGSQPRPTRARSRSLAPSPVPSPASRVRAPVPEETAGSLLSDLPPTDLGSPMIDGGVSGGIVARARAALLQSGGGAAAQRAVTDRIVPSAVTVQRRDSSSQPLSPDVRSTDNGRAVPTAPPDYDSDSDALSDERVNTASGTVVAPQADGSEDDDVRSPVIQTRSAFKAGSQSEDQKLLAKVRVLIFITHAYLSDTVLDAPIY